MGLTHCSADETYSAQFAMMLAGKFPSISVCRYDGITYDELRPMDHFTESINVNIAKGEKKIDVIRNGIGGNTVRRAINRINDFTGILANGESADITIFMFGINDALKSDSKKYVIPDKFYDDYNELLEKFQKNEKSQIVIMSSTTNDQTIDKYVKMAEKIADEHKFLYIDQNKVWNEHYDKNAPNFGYGNWLANDACHPTPCGAKAIADEIMKYVV